MFIEFTIKDGTRILLNTAHIVSVELPTPLAGLQGGVQQMRIHCLEGRVYSVDPKIVTFESLREQIEPKELTSNVRPDQDSPVG
jgi:hypothetical protein